jgi:hypothetical protein
MRFFLTAKHWQLFLLFIGLPMVLQISLFAASASSFDLSPAFLSFPLASAISSVIIFGWFYSIGSNLYKKLPESIKMNLACFRILLVLFLICMIAISALFFRMISEASSNETILNFQIVKMVIPINLIVMFSLLYCLYFISKALKTIELQKPVAFTDFVGEFFLLLFFVVGIWIIQPRINKIFINPNPTK